MKPHVVFVDDEQSVLDSLQRLLRGHRHAWDILCLNDPLRAWEHLERHGCDVLVSDVNMPALSGLDLLDRVKASIELRDLPVIILTGMADRQLKREALDRGATDLLNKPVHPEDLVARLASALRLKAYQDELRAHNEHLERRVQHRTAQLTRSRVEAIWRLAKATEYRDDDTGRHVIRVACTSCVIAESLGIGRDFVDTLFLAAPLHDIGKIAIPDAILLKSGPLNQHEREVMNQHCVIGARILQDDVLAADAFARWGGSLLCGTAEPSDNPILQMAANIAWMHHEKWDGTGYPRGLVGEQIPLEARIVAIADVFDALTSHRPYKAAFADHVALEILQHTARSHFDPKVYSAFRRCLPAIRAIQQQYGDRPRYCPDVDEVYDVAHSVHR